MTLILKEKDFSADFGHLFNPAHCAIHDEVYVGVF